MKILRLHILKTIIVGLICSGLMACFAKPTNATPSNEDFANWLQSLTKKAHAPGLEQKLSSLKQSNADLDQLIRKASEIVSQNNDDFNIPLNIPSDNIQHILLVEWNQYQNGNAMTAVPSNERVKPAITAPQQKALATESQAYNSAIPVFEGSIEILAVSDLITCNPHFTVPMASGIAIGAP